jgi:Cof subfamily protein (haloacid dehalogenase superfamily)
MTADLRLVVSDVDGTLVRSDKSLSEPVIAAVERLKAAGVAVSLISARPPSGMVWIAKELRLSAAMAAFNGGTIIAPDGKVLSASRLPEHIAEQALELIGRPGVIRWLFSAGRWYAERADGIHDARERKSANQEPTFGGEFSGLLGAVDKIVAVSDDHVLLAGLEETVAQVLGKNATVARSQLYYLDITAPAANKGDGVDALAAAAGMALENVAAIGDQRNDMAMFGRAGFSIAMGQAPKEVRAAADRMTVSNDEDGVAKAIDEILLPMIRTKDE